MPGTKSPQKNVLGQLTQQVKNRPKISLLLIILVILGLLYYFKSLFVVAIVNGEPISRLVLIKELEKQGGKQTLESLISKALILQEAKKQNAIISKAEIDQEVKKIEKDVQSQGQTLDQILAVRGMSKNDLVEQVRIQKLIEKILAKDIKVTDKEVDEYIEGNKITPPEGQRIDDVKAQIKEQLRQQKLEESFQTWIENLKKNAKINYFLNY